MAVGRSGWKGAAMPFVRQAEYARRRGVSQEAVRKRAMTGAIPVYGSKHLIDVDEADAIWDATKTPQGEGGAEAVRSESAAVIDATTYQRVKTRRMAALAKREELELRVRERELV